MNRVPLRALWDAAHAPVADAPRWARIAAYSVPLTVLPSSLWRIAAIFFEDERGAGNLPSWLPEPVYVVLLSVVSELVAFTAVGMVATWGDVFPRWIPVLRGRRVPTLAAVIPAAVGAVILTLMWTWTFVSQLLGRDVRGRPLPEDFPLDYDTWGGVIANVAYAPLLLWGPLLGAVTVAYWRRRTLPAPA
ncbi:MAG TPA: hypothetical protein VHJ17_25240 [Thermomonospora sp.]|nr:hypothetical protein [Thermomonospora sp.]